MSLYQQRPADPVIVNAVRWEAEDANSQYRTLGWLDANDIRIKFGNGEAYELVLPSGGVIPMYQGQYVVRFGTPGRYTFKVMDEEQFKDEFAPIDD